MSDKGWFSVHRSLSDHWLWKKEKFTKGQAWVDLVMLANHKKKKVMIKGRLITIERGEQIRSKVTLAKTWKWNERTVTRFLELLKSEGMITTKSTELTTHISICNYNTFQDTTKNSTDQNTQQSAEAVQSRVQTNNNVNNDNKKDIGKKPTPLKINKPEDVEEEVWQDWNILRKTKKAPVTNTVLNGAIKEADKAGLTLNEFLSIWCARGSQGLQASWLTPDDTVNAKPKYEGNVI
jgi:DNA-binding transcriptional regulator YhcF (GntR family)